MKAYSAIAQVIYQNSIMFMEKSIINEIVNKNKLFTNRKFDHNQNILFLGNMLTNETAQVSETQATFQIEKEPDKRQIVDHSIDFLNNVLSSLSIDDIDRIGLRIYWGIPLEKREEGVQLIKNNLLHSFPWNNITDNPTGASIAFNFTENNFKINVKIDSVTAQFVRVNQSDSINITEHYLEADIDVYKNVQIAKKDIESFLKEAYELSKQKAEHLLSVVGGQNNENP